MAQSAIEPSTVTKPIQLLAAWWAGLILIDSGFLTAAAQIEHPNWASGALVVAAIVNVPLIVLLLFYMQTKYRLEMLSDKDYVDLKIRSAETGKTETIRVEKSQVEAKPVVELDMAEVVVAPDRGSILINDLLPQFNEIVSELRSKGISVSNTFGSTSEEPEPPAPFIVTIGRGFNIQLMQEILTVLDRFELEGVYLSLHGPNENTIFIGAYNYRTQSSRIVKFDAALREKLLDPLLTQRQLFQLLTSGDVSSEAALDSVADNPDE